MYGLTYPCMGSQIRIWAHKSMYGLRNPCVGLPIYENLDTRLLRMGGTRYEHLCYSFGQANVFNANRYRKEQDQEQRTKSGS